MEEEAQQKSVFQSFDIVTSILLHLSSPRDILSAAAVCRIWRHAATDHGNLRAWTLDDTPDFAPGVKTSSTPLLPKTPPPKQWVNPTAYSPLASFKVPRSLQQQRNTSFQQSAAPSFKVYSRFPCEPHGNACSSPRTPSPIREPVKRPPLFDIVKEKIAMGRFLGDVDIISSRMSDDCLQLILRSCPHLHTFRLVHACSSKLKDGRELFSSNVEVDCSQKTLCNCSPLSNKAFSGVCGHCPNLASVTLVLQHVTFKKVLRKLLMELGQLPKLQTLSIELRVPSFGQSTKSKVIWESHVRVTEQELYAMIQAGPPPLQALALNRCDLSGASLAALANACPHIVALELHSEFDDTKEHNFLQSAPSRLLGLTSLSAAAFGILQSPETCSFDEWQIPALKRLRLETTSALSVRGLRQLKSACPELESVHLIWNGAHGMMEVHIYPFAEENLLAYAEAVL